MEILDGTPYQYGVSVFDQNPVRFPQKTLQKILGNICNELTSCLADSPYQVFLSKRISLGGAILSPDLVVINGQNEVVLLAEMAAAGKYDRLQQCEEAGVDYWVIFPDSQCVSVYSVSNGGVYGSGDTLSVATTGRVIRLQDVWELPLE